MQTKRKVISKKNLPTNLPLVSSLVFWLVLDKLNAPGWAWGVVATLMIILWIVSIIDIFIREDFEILKDKNNV
jgi:hypothetical protein